MLSLRKETFSKSSLPSVSKSQLESILKVMMIGKHCMVLHFSMVLHFKERQNSTIYPLISELSSRKVPSCQIHNSMS